METTVSSEQPNADGGPILSPEHQHQMDVLVAVLRDIASNDESWNALTQAPQAYLAGKGIIVPRGYDIILQTPQYSTYQPAGLSCPPGWELYAKTELKTVCTRSVEIHVSRKTINPKTGEIIVIGELHSGPFCLKEERKFVTTYSCVVSVLTPV